MPGQAEVPSSTPHASPSSALHQAASMFRVLCSPWWVSRLQGSSQGSLMGLEDRLSPPLTGGFSQVPVVISLYH